MIQLLLAVWSLMVMGHILRHTFDISQGRGLAIAVLYTLLSYVVVMSLFTTG
jgi:alcohol dehydrogenase YqhD (iron-dependent ADH family)